MKINYKNFVLRYLFFNNLKVYQFCNRLKWIIISAFFNFLALQIFIVPTNAIGGGITGLALFFYHLLYPNTLSNSSNTIILFLIQLAMNVPLIIFGFFKIGKKFTILTIFYLLFEIVFSLLYGAFHLEGLFHFFEQNKGGGLPSSAKIISCLFGGLLYGFGCVCAYNSLGSTGGNDFITVYFSYKHQKNIGKVNFIINCVIITIGTYFLKRNSSEGFFSIDLLATLIFAFTYSFFIDNFFPRQKNVSVFIVTSDENKIKSAFKEANFQRSYTKIDSVGAFKGTKNAVLLTTMTIFEYHHIIQKIKIHDQNAFVFVTKIWRISGNFRRINWND